MGMGTKHVGFALGSVNLDQLAAAGGKVQSFHLFVGSCDGTCEKFHAFCSRDFHEVWCVGNHVVTRIFVFAIFM